MKEINIAEILRDCPKGTKLYSPAFGDLFLEEVGTERIYTYKDVLNKDWIVYCSWHDKYIKYSDYEMADALYNILVQLIEKNYVKPKEL